MWDDIKAGIVNMIMSILIIAFKSIQDMLKKPDHQQPEQV